MAPALQPGFEGQGSMGTVLYTRCLPVWLPRPPGIDDLVLMNESAVLIVDLVSQVNSAKGGPLRPALAVMARAPSPGRVKTRLCPPLAPEEAAEFYDCLLRDVLGDLSRSERWDTWVAYAERSRDYFLKLREPRVALLPQRGASLGDRMHAVFVDLGGAGYRQVVLVGSDVPGLAKTSVRTACEVLEQGRCDVALGPAHDGGYYLIGLNRPAEGLFRGVSWSTGSVLDQTLARARDLRLRTHLVSAAYDVDVAEDLQRLRRDLDGSRELRAVRPRTHAWMSRRAQAPGEKTR